VDVSGRDLFPLYNEDVEDVNHACPNVGNNERTKELMFR
jgi:hypothetical protein